MSYTLNLCIDKKSNSVSGVYKNMQKTHDNNGPKVRLKTVNIHSCERLRDAMCYNVT